MVKGQNHSGHLGRTYKQATTNYREEWKPGGPRLDATDKSGGEDGTEAMAGIVQAGDNRATAQIRGMVGTSNWPFASAQIEQAPWVAGVLRCNCE